MDLHKLFEELVGRNLAEDVSDISCDALGKSHVSLALTEESNASLRLTPPDLPSLKNTFRYT